MDYLYITHVIIGHHMAYNIDRIRFDRLQSWKRQGSVFIHVFVVCLSVAAGVCLHSPHAGPTGVVHGRKTIEWDILRWICIQFHDLNGVFYIILMICDQVLWRIPVGFCQRKPRQIHRRIHRLHFNAESCLSQRLRTSLLLSYVYTRHCTLCMRRHHASEVWIALILDTLYQRCILG
jgi:hypothetical protein